MKDNKCNCSNGITLIFIVLLIISILSCLKLDKNLSECRFQNSKLSEYIEQSGNVNEKNEMYKIILRDYQRYLYAYEKDIALLNNQLLLIKDKCPICPIGEECIKLVKENKFQCINREIVK